MRISVKQTGIYLRRTPAELRSFDVHLGGIRVWSFSVNKKKAKVVKIWPQRLAEKLRGYTDVEVFDSTSKILLTKKRIKFDSTDYYFRLLDPEGKPLMLNKWMRLAPMLDSGSGEDLREPLVHIIKKVQKDLESLGHTVFAVGGTALGPYRDGDFFSHDDDGDLAVFFDTEDQMEVGLKILSIARKLEKSGYRIRAHSHAHLQAYPPQSENYDLYVDIFAAFFKNGYINQPFHVRGQFDEKDLFPFAQVKVRGEKFPVANNTPKWFEINYDENWETPLPGFRLKTPRTTSRRFKSWFGSYNIHRHYWDAYFRDEEHINDFVRSGKHEVHKRIEFFSPTIINMGSGSNPLLPDNIETAHPRPTIWALDYSDEARRLAERNTKKINRVNIKVRDVNANNYHALLNFVKDLPREPFDLYLGFLLEGQTHKRRQTSIWRLARMALLSGGNVVADYVTSPVQEVKRSNPRGWHLEPQEIVDEAKEHGLIVQPLFSSEVLIENQERPYDRVRFELSRQ